MLRPLIILLVLSPFFLNAQTTLRITDVKITENGTVQIGTDVTASLKRDEGSKGVVIYADQDMEVTGTFKVRSHNVGRSSVKNSAVYLTMYLKLRTGGKTDQREVMKTFYMEDKRDAEFSEKFVVKRGIDTRIITVSFKGELE